MFAPDEAADGRFCSPVRGEGALVNERTLECISGVHDREHVRGHIALDIHRMPWSSAA